MSAVRFLSRLTDYLILKPCKKVFESDVAYLFERSWLEIFKLGYFEFTLAKSFLCEVNLYARHFI